MAINKKIYLAFYHGKPDIKELGLIGWVRSIIGDALTRYFTKSIFTHCELVVPIDDSINPLYKCYTSSIRDKGVRVKVMQLNPEKWVLIPIETFLRPENNKRKDTDEDLIRFFGPYLGQKYDFWGAAGIVTGIKDRSNRWFCSEICAAYLGLNNSYIYSPELLYNLANIKIPMVDEGEQQ